jgi:hypothetical protein
VDAAKTATAVRDVLEDRAGDVRHLIEDRAGDVRHLIEDRAGDVREVVEDVASDPQRRRPVLGVLVLVVVMALVLGFLRRRSAAEQKKVETPESWRVQAKS